VRIQCCDEKTRRTLKIPKRSEVFGWWCLPMMAKAVAADERRFEEAERVKRKQTMADDLMKLAKRVGAKVTVNGK